MIHIAFLDSLHGPLAVAILCLLLLVEEAGVPVPLVPGDLLLVAAGLLIANGDVSPVVFLPLAILSAVVGAVVGHSWARLVGATGIRSLAKRLRATHHLDHAAQRLGSAGPAGIALCRLIPGMRVNTTLLAGALGIGRRPFLLGVTPVIVVWVVALTELGALAGVPVERALGRVDHLALQGAILVVMGAVAYLAVRHLPPSRERDDGCSREPGWRKMSLAAAIDLGAIASMVVGFDIIARLVLRLGEPDGWYDAIIVVVTTTLAYLLASRKSAGQTVGEALLRVTYRPGSDAENSAA